MTGTFTSVAAELDSICRRQTARLIGHLERTGQLTPQLERDVARQFGFVFADVKQVLLGHFQESANAKT